MTHPPRTPLIAEEIPGYRQAFWRGRLAMHRGLAIQFEHAADHPPRLDGRRVGGGAVLPSCASPSASPTRGGQGETSLEVIPGQVAPFRGVVRGGAQTSFLDPLISFDVISLDELNSCLVRWGHKMGALNRPTPTRAHGLRHNGRLVAVTATDYLMAAAVKGLARSDAVELSRVCAERPDLCRVAVRLWREFILPTTGKPWAISYQDAVIHGGNLYRFDGWVRLGFSHSGKDTRSGRPGRDKWVWAWNADPLLRTPLAAGLKSGEAA